MTEGKVPPRTAAAGFTFMRWLRQPEFRSYLRQHAWQEGEHVIIATEDEPVVDVMARILLHETGGRALVAIPDDRHRFDFRLLSIEVAGRRRRRVLKRHVEAVNIAPNATIGMLYAAFAQCAEYVPSEWSATVTVRKQPSA